jgi:hypothetical protein
MERIVLPGSARNYQAAIPVGTSVRIRAKSARGVYTEWVTATVLPLPPIVNPESKDLGVKFGLAAPASGQGYTPAQVRQIMDAVHMYAQAGMAGSFAVGDYLDLNALSTPAVTVKDGGDADMEFLAESLTNTALINANYTGYTDGAQLRFHIESIDGYFGKNGNTAHHIVFRSWSKLYGNKSASDYYTHYGRMNNSNITTGGWAASGAKKFLNGAFLAALNAAGIPSEYLMDTKRKVSVSTSAAEIDTSKVFLATEWEEFGARSYAPAVENDGTEIHFGTVPVGNSGAHIKYPLDEWGGSHYGHHWLSSVCSGAYFCNVVAMVMPTAAMLVMRWASPPLSVSRSGAKIFLGFKVR